MSNNDNNHSNSTGSNRWVDERRAVIKDSAFNRGVSGVRQTQLGIQALPAPPRPNATQTLPAIASTGSFPYPGISQTFSSASEAQAFLEHVAQPAAAPKPQAQPTDDVIEERAFYDPQTRTYTLRYLVRVLQRELNRARYYSRPLSLMVVALNDLTSVETTYGLLPYSLALREVSQTLINCRGPIDMVARYTEDRFIFLCPEMDFPKAVEFAEDLCARFRTLAVPCQYPLHLPASIGIATYSEELCDLESLLAIADLGADLVIQKGGDGTCYAPDAVE
jgi:diguanylate cyclase (GGDEF)-like protein